MSCYFRRLHTGFGLWHSANNCKWRTEKMIYLVEDDESIRELVIYTLKSQGFEAKGFERPSHFWKEIGRASCRERV